MGSAGGEAFNFARFESELVALSRGFDTVPDLAESFTPEMIGMALPGMTEAEWRGYFGSDAEAQEALEASSTKRQVGLN